MYIPVEAIIPDDKLTRYLLVHRDYDDKSQYLAQAGFTRNNTDALFATIRQLTRTQEAVYESTNEYGNFLTVTFCSDR